MKTVLFQGDNEENNVDALFKNPGSYYRGAPFWAWNTKLDQEQLKKQIGYFKEMGMGGFHMHSRTGLDTPYMEEEFLSMVQFCVQEAKKNGMYAYLYDEDRWPSGAAGGKVTKNKAYRSRYLVLTKIPNEQRRRGGNSYSSSAHVSGNGNGILAAAYQLDWKEGVLNNYKRLDITRELPEDCWYVYLETASESPWYNNQTYVDTLNAEAIQEFIRQTHEKYYNLLGDEMGKTIPSIFTDEPQFPHKTQMGKANEKTDIILPYTESFEERYRERYNESLFDRLPEIIWESSQDTGHMVRYRYHELLAEQFSHAFADTVGKWCEEHKIMLTGHMMEEPTLRSQTAALGEAMRSYRSFQMPGIDMLCDNREYNTAKQAQSAAHQFGREGVLSELYGVTNWDFDFRRHKLQGDWQAALGVTRRVPHLAWMSMAGEAKRDYPASIFYQSPWYREYHLLEDHYARLNTVLMSGRPVVKIAVIHPIESYWLYYGPREQNGMICQEMEDRFAGLTEWLLFEHYDFDFIAESLLAEIYRDCSEPVMQAGSMSYDVIIVPGCETLRRTTLTALESFAQRGGRVVVLGNLPLRLDGAVNPDAAEIGNFSVRLPFEKGSLVKALEPYRTVRICNLDGEEAQDWIYQLRLIRDDFWLFIANGRAQKNPDVENAQELQISKAGAFHVFLYDTLCGTIAEADYDYENGMTQVRLTAWEHDSFLLRFCPADQIENFPICDRAVGKEAGSQKKKAVGTERILKQPKSFRLSESNVMLLDGAYYRLDDGAWQDREEILRIDDKIRNILGYPQRMEAVAQPWTIQKKKSEHIVELKFAIRSEIAVRHPQLALELKEDWEVFVNGEPLVIEEEGYFADACIRKINLPDFSAGKNEILLKIPFGEKTDLEWCYLLGDFGVRVEGDQSCLVPMPSKVYFGDYAAQSFPFYAGNMEYICRVSTNAGHYGIRVTKFRSPLLRVLVDGRDCGPIMIAPYELDLGYLDTGEHEICIRAYGNRFNAFGTVHHCNEVEAWAGPNAWRTTGNEYAYEYQLKKMGVLKAPELFRYEEF